MTGDELDRAIEFLLEGQANHQVRLDELTGNINQLTRQIAETNRVVQLNAETVSQFIEIDTRTFERLEVQQVRTDKTIAETNRSIAESSARTDKRIAEINQRV